MSDTTPLASNATANATTTFTTTTLLSTTTNATLSTSSVTQVVTSTLTTLLTTLNNGSMVTTTLPTNQTEMYEKCLQTNSKGTCRLAEFIHIFAYLILAVSLLPQIIYSFNHGSKYISGISYSWIVIRVVALGALMMAHGFDWLSVFEFMSFISSVAIFLQILIYSDNLHRQQKILLIIITISTWTVGGGTVLIFKKYSSFLRKMGYILLAGHMLPQILLNSLLRTAKALSPFSTMFLALSSALLFSSFYTFKEDFIYLVTSYYSFSFFLFIYLQSVVYIDSNIHLISRSAHTVLTPGVDIFTGLDVNGARATGQDPQMFSIDDLETPDATDVVYQPVTANKSNQPAIDQSPMKRITWYGTLAAIFAIEAVLTIMLILRAWSPWIIFVPLSIPSILGLFFFVRVKLNDLQMETLRKIL